MRVMKMMISGNYFLNLRVNREGVNNMHISNRGFTLIEVLVIVVILSIVGMVAIPMMGSTAITELKAAANMVSADLEYAKSIAIAKGQIYSVQFDTGAESYRVKDQNGSTITHPVNGVDYVVDFSADSRIDQVTISSVNFDSTNEVKFDYLGNPLNGNDDSLSSGTVTLEAGGQTMTIEVEPVTGYISIL